MDKQLPSRLVVLPHLALSLLVSTPLLLAFPVETVQRMARSYLVAALACCVITTSAQLVGLATFVPTFVVTALALAALWYLANAVFTALVLVPWRRSKERGVLNQKKPAS